MFTKHKKISSIILTFFLLLTVFPTHAYAQPPDTFRTYASAGNVFRFEASMVTKTYGDAPFVNPVTNTYDMTSSKAVYSSSDQSIASIDSATGQVTIHGAGLVEIEAYIFYIIDERKETTSLLSTAGYVLYIKPDMSVQAYTGTYDGTLHAPSVTAAGGGTVYYNTDGPLNSENYDRNGTTEAPQRTDAGDTQVYYLVKPVNGFSKTSEDTLRQMPQYFITGRTQISIRKAAPLLMFASASVAKTSDSPAFINALEKTTDGTVTFSSDNPSVAAVDSVTGRVTLGEEGTAVITASAAEGNNYTAGTASYTLSVRSSSQDVPDQEPEDPDKNPSGSLSACTAVLSQDTFTYNGKPQTPSVTVKDRSGILSAGIDYTVDYADHIQAGTATVTINGKGAYTGSLTKTFTIRPAAPVLAFASASLTKSADSAPFINTLTKETDGAVTFSSDCPAVAETDRITGLVTVKGSGPVKITASASAGRNYTVGTASYTLVIEKQPVKPQASYDTTSLTYSFANSRHGFGYSQDYRIPLEVYQYVFGDNAKAVFYYTRNKNWFGNCFGMSSTAGMFNMTDSGIQVQAFRQTAKRVKELKTADRNTDLGLSVKRLIEVMQTAQYIDYAQKKMRDGMNDLDGLCRQLRQAETGGGPVMICIFGPEGGHAIAAWRLEDMDGNKSRIYVYDCNYPNTERTIDLTRDSSGGYQTWHYYLNDMYHWGTDYQGCRITCIPYEDYKHIWNSRKGGMSIYANGVGEAAMGTMEIHAQNAVIYNETMQEVGRLVSGQLQTAETDIHQLYVLGITADQTGRTDGGAVMLSLPAGSYFVKNEDTGGKTFAVAMADTQLSVHVSTESDLVSIQADDAAGEAAASIDTQAGESYQIEMYSAMPEHSGSLKTDGIGSGETVGLSQKNGTVHAINIEDAQIKKDAWDGSMEKPDTSGEGVRKPETDGGNAGSSQGQETGRRMNKGDIFTYNAVRYKVSQADLSGTKVNVTCMGFSGYAQKKLSISRQFTMDGIVCTVTKIGAGAFAGSSLAGISLPDSITSIGPKAFQDCRQLKKITIPAKVKAIGKRAFYGCGRLKKIVIKTKKLANGTIGSRAFYGISAKAVITVPKGRTEVYRKLLRACGVTRKVKVKN